MYKEWIMTFGSKEKDGIEAFKNYIHFWLLDAFVDKENEYQVVSLVNSDLENNLLQYIDESEPYFPGLVNNPLRVNINSIRRQLFATEDKSTYSSLYRKYIKNSTYAIQERNKKIKFGLMCNHNKY